MRLIIILIFLSLVKIQLGFSQSYNRSEKDITHSQPINKIGNYDWKARDFIRFLPGASMTGSSSRSGRFHIDPYLIFPVDYDYTPVNVDTRDINTSLSVGATPGFSEVTLTGGASYVIPISVPTGTAEMQPSLSVSYNSQNGNGLLGMGWNLQGISSISRTGQTFPQDGIVRGVHFDSEDRFELDGIRLVVVSGTYGASGSQYRTEIESFTKITANGNANNGPVSYTAETKDGKIIEFGHTDDSRIELANSPEVFHWLVNRIKDRKGNYMDFIYDEENSTGTYRIKEIKYTGNSNNGLMPEFLIKFRYVTRDDAEISYVMGQKVTQNKLLDQIRVFHSNKMVKLYQFKYSFSFYSHLSEITEFNKGLELNSTIFNYHNQPSAFTASSSLIYNTKGYDLYSGDYDGDGLSDLLTVPYDYMDGKKYQTDFLVYQRTAADPQYHNTYYDVLPQNSEVHNTYTYKLSKPYNFLGSDYDGDGRDDILITHAYGKGSDKILANFKLYYSKNNRTFQDVNYPADEIYNIIPPSGNFLWSGDFDGDGRADFISILGSGNGYKVFYHQPHINNIEEIKNLYPPDILSKHIHVIDINGDGKTGLIGFNPGLTGVYTSAVSYSFTIDSKGFYRTGQTAINIPPIMINSVFPGDFNGDGKTDFLFKEFNAGWSIAYSTGLGFVYKPFTFNNNVNISDDKLMIGDFNGDGKSDIYHGFNQHISGNTTTSKINIYYCKGESFIHEQHNFNWSLGYTAPTLADFNGDGRVDIINRGTFSSPIDVFSFKKDGKEFLLEKVSDGLGYRTQFTYNRINSDNGSYSQSSVAYAFPLVKIKPALYVVSKYQQSDGTGGLTNIDYLYKDAILHQQGKGFFGFSSIIERNNISGINVEKTIGFKQSFGTSIDLYFPFLIKEEKKLNTNELISKREFTNNIRLFYPILTPVRFLPFVSKVVKSDYLPKNAGGNEIFTTTTDYSYYSDDFHNLKEIKTDQNGEASSITLYENYSSNGSWCPYVPEKVTTTLNRTGETSIQTITDYTYSTTNGNLLTIIKNSGTSESVKTEYSNYDAFGNPQAITISATGLPLRTISYEYDKSGRFVKKAINPMGDVVKHTYDPVTGNILTQTDPNNLTTTFTYDVFGRLIKTKNAAGVEIESQLKWASGGPSLAVYYKEISGQNMPTTKIWYDILGREIRKDAQGFNGDNISSTLTYNAKGEVVSNVRAKFTAETPYTTTNTYDVRGRLTKITNPTFGISYEYDGLKVKETNINTGQWVEKTLSKTGVVESVQDLAGKIYYTYNSLGQPRRIRFIPTSGSFTTVNTNYDQFGRQISLSDPNTGTINYEYNAFGEMTKQIDGKGNETTIQYDQMGRVTIKEFKDNMNVVNSYAYEYEKGRIVRETSPDVVTNYHYNSLGRLVMATKKVGSESFIKRYEYDTQGRITKEKYPSGFAVTNVYNSFGYLSEINRANNGENIWKATSMDARGKMLEWKVGTGNLNITGENAYNSDDYLELQGLTNPDNVFWSPYYQWNTSSGNLINRSVSFSDGGFSSNEAFTYDNLNRLNTQEQSSPYFKIETIYDNLGNIKTKSDAGEFSYGEGAAGPHAVSTVKQFVNIPTIAQNITYNAFNSVESITEESSGIINEARFIYGPDEQRTSMSFLKDNNLQYTRYYYGNYEKQVNEDGSIREWNYINTPTGLTAILIGDKADASQVATETMLYVAQDHLGSITALINNNGNVVERFSYDSWGRRRNPIDWDDYNPISFQATGGGFSDYINRGFTLHEHLDEFGIINMNGRLYDPLIGRMLSPDNHVQSPMNSQSYNRYSYAWNNPLKYTDPSGESAVAGVIIVGVYLAAMTYHNGYKANGGQPNPLKWNWRNAHYQVGVSTGGGNTTYSGGVSWNNGGQYANMGYNTSSGAGVGYTSQGQSSFQGANSQPQSIGSINMTNVDAARGYKPNYKGFEVGPSQDELNASDGLMASNSGPMVDDNIVNLRALGTQHPLGPGNGFGFDYINMTNQNSLQSNRAVVFNSVNNEVRFPNGQIFNDVNSAPGFYGGPTKIINIIATPEPQGQMIFDNFGAHPSYNPNRHYFRYYQGGSNLWRYGSIPNSLSDGTPIIWPR